MDPLDLFFNEIGKESDKKASGRKNYMEIDDEDTKEIAEEIEEKKIIEDIKIDKEKANETVPIIKNIYIPPAEFSNKSREEVEQLRKDLGNIVVHGLNVPSPIANWTDCGLPEPILQAIKLRNFERPTPIQCQAIPCILSGRDIIGCAVTGSGKTLAFILPCLLHVLAQPKTGQNEAAAVLLAPTRELALQTHSECKAFFELMGLKTVCLFGGGDIENQLAAIKNGVSVIVATPGRFVDLLTHSSFNLDRCGFFVVDEADRMFDLGFEPQVMRIADRMRSDRQTLMFSATFPHTVERCARKLLTNSIEIVVGVRNVVSSDIEQHILVISEDEKLNKLLKVLGEHSSEGEQALVFTNTQDKAELLFGQLTKYGYSASFLHAGMEQTDRACILHDFRDHRYDILVVTSVGARGIDISSISLVVNYDAPDHEADYVHRIGRTGRAGKKGFAYTFVTWDERQSANEIKNALKKSCVEIPEDLLKVCGDEKSTKVLGFRRGKGFRFDKVESKALLEQRKATTDKDKIKVDEDDDNEPSNDEENEESKENVEQKPNDAEIEKELNERIEKKFNQKESENNYNIKKLSDTFYTCDFEINDFSQRSRQSIMTAASINAIMEETGTSIIQKGIYCPPGVKPPPGSQKLFLRVEGTTKYAVEVSLSRINEIAANAESFNKRGKKNKMF